MTTLKEQIHAVDHKTIIEAAEALCIEFPFVNIILQNISPSAISNKYVCHEGLGCCHTRSFPNGSTIAVYNLLSH